MLSCLAWFMDDIMIDYITGEKFQGLADVSLIPNGRDVGESECDFVIEQNRNNGYTTFYYDENTKELPEYVKNAKVLFVNTWTLDRFFRCIYDLLPNRYVFISHNSDNTFSNKHERYLNDEKVVKWYSQNAIISHDKLILLPIGLANRQYKHGNLSLMDRIVKENASKTNLVYKNFDIYTNFNIRNDVNNITSKNNIIMNPRVEQEEYLQNLAKSVYCINPEGNGIDCHRMWECFYLKTIPVAKFQSGYERFKKFPILFVDCWEKVTLNFLNQNVSNFDFDIRELDFNYWKDVIKYE